MEYEGEAVKPKIQMDECTSNENAVDDSEIFHVILNQCKLIHALLFLGAVIFKQHV